MFFRVQVVLVFCFDTYDERRIKTKYGFPLYSDEFLTPLITPVLQLHVHIIYTSYMREDHIGTYL